MRRFAILAVLAGCWTTPDPVGPAVRLRRHHATGDVVRVCMRGDGTVTSPALTQPITLVVRNIYDERLIDVSARELVLRDDTVLASARLVVPGHDPIAVDIAKHEGERRTVDDRNRRIGVAITSPQVVETDRFSLSFVLDVTELTDIAFPEGALRKHQTFPLRVRRTIPHADALPTTRAIELMFTVREVTAHYVDLACTGTHVESAERGAQRVAVALEVTCRARIDRRDGRTSRWSIDARGATSTLPGEAKAAMAVQSHYDVAIGGADPRICERAAAP